MKKFFFRLFFLFNLTYVFVAVGCLNLGELSTECPNPITRNLSAVFKQNPQEGLALLQEVDKGVVDGGKAFHQNFLPSIVEDLFPKLKDGGRIVFAGCGSSGRVGIDFAAKWAEFWEAQLVQHSSVTRATLTEILGFDHFQSVQGEIAGGLRAFVKAREKFEDSELDGQQAAIVLGLKRNDTLVSVSASGSARFNKGISSQAYEQGAQVYYFHNSKVVPAHTQELFDGRKAISICVDTGGEAITGSTRLKSASVAEACWGAVLNELLHRVTQGTIFSVSSDVRRLIENIEERDVRLRGEFREIQKIIEAESSVFSHPEANFFRLKDRVPPRGQITYLAVNPDTFRQSNINAVEVPPTFSTNVPAERNQLGENQAEYRAYLLGPSTNEDAWRFIAKKEGLREEDLQEANKILLGAEAGEEGEAGRYMDRSKGKNDLVFGVLNRTPGEAEILQLQEALEKVKIEGGKIGLIAVVSKATLKLPAFKALQALVAEDHTSVVMEEPSIEFDPLGIASTLTLKQLHNLLSNGTMISLGKVNGNLMVGQKISNEKLRDREIRATTNLYKMLHPDHLATERESVTRLIDRLREVATNIGTKGFRLPDFVPLAAQMLYREGNLKTAMTEMGYNLDEYGEHQTLLEGVSV